MAEVKGAKELIKKLQKLADTELDKSMKKATLLVEGSAKEYVAVDTGDLRGSIHPKVTKPSKYEVTGHVYTALEYGPFVEFGTGVRGEASNTNPDVEVSYDPDWQGQVAQPYLYPALVNNRSRIMKILGEDLEKTIKRKATKL